MTERKYLHPKYGVVLWAIDLSHISTQEDPHDCVVEKTDWPFVPRVGEHVEADCEEHGQHVGTVRIVMWDRFGQPQVRFR